MLQQCTSFGPTTVLNVAQLGWHKVLLSSQLPSGILCLMCVFYELDHKRLESCSFTSKSADLFLLGTFLQKNDEIKRRQTDCAHCILISVFADTCYSCYSNITRRAWSHFIWFYRRAKTGFDQTWISCCCQVLNTIFLCYQTQADIKKQTNIATV